MPPPPRTRWWNERRGLAAVYIGLLAVLGIGGVALTAGTSDPEPDSEVRGQRFASPSADAGQAAQQPTDGSGSASRPEQVVGAASIDVEGAVSLAVTLVWADAVPAVIEVGQPMLGAIEAVPDDTSAVLGRPEASLDGSPLPVEAAAPGAWRVIAPEGGSTGTVLLTYQVDDALHRDRLALPGRALAVIPLPTVGASADTVRQVSLPTQSILNVSCPASTGGAVPLCATHEEDGSWLVDVPPEADVVLAQMDLPAL